MSLYHDPKLKHSRPSLVKDLLGLQRTTSQHPLEDQSTTVLAWLCDRSPVVARRVLELFLGDACEIAVEDEIGARTQVRLPKGLLLPGALRPDLSICVADRKVQLLVEVKVGAGFAVYPEFGGRVQPDVYRHLWQDSPAEAELRAVGTLTRDGGAAAAQQSATELRARDVSWRELRDVLVEVLASGEVADDVRLVTASFVEAIDSRIGPEPPSAEAAEAFFSDHASFLQETADSVAMLLGTSSITKHHGAWFRARRVHLEAAPGGLLLLRVYLAPAGGKQSLPGSPDAIVVGLERDFDGHLDDRAGLLAELAGFQRDRDIAGAPMYRRVWPLEDAVAEDVALEIAEAVHAAGLAGTAADALGPPTVRPGDADATIR